MITDEEKESLMRLWNDEREDDEWRLHLTDEEAALVAEWDEQYATGLARMIAANKHTEEGVDGRAIFI